MLAQTLAADQVPTISREVAKQLEFRGQHEQALQMYHKGLGDASPFSGGPWADDVPHERLCRIGVAKMSLLLGDVGRGVSLALEGGDRECCKDCAAILEGLKQWPDAARLYEMAELPEKAAAIHIKTKNWGAVAPLMSRISSSKLHSECAAGVRPPSLAPSLALPSPSPTFAHLRSPSLAVARRLAGTRRPRRPRARPRRPSRRTSAPTTSTAWCASS